MKKNMPGILKWIFKNLLLFLIVLSILTFMAWVATEWVELKKGADRITELDNWIEEKQVQLDKASADVAEYGESLADLKKAKRILEYRRREKNKAENTLHKLQTKCGIFQRLCNPVLLEKIGVAKIKVAESTAKFTIALKKYQALAKALAPDGSIIQKVENLEEDIRLFTQQRNDLEKKINSTPIKRALSLAEKQIDRAATIVVIVVMFPFFIRTLIYYVLAPFVQLLKPVIIDDSEYGIIRHESASTSVDLAIQEGRELLVRQNALQSVSTSASKTTRWFLNELLPLSSVASGLYLLTAIRGKKGAPENVTVSLDDDLYGKLCILDLKDGARIVLKPHAIVGVVKNIEEQVKVTRKWRLFSLHSWLTFQFRYLVFHGPLQIVVHGCRGVRVETPDAESLRLVDSRAMIGFSANLEYTNYRVETFIPYLLGYEALLKNCFGGGPGTFLYEETIDPKRKNSWIGRGFDGFIDGVMRALGI